MAPRGDLADLLVRIALGPQPQRPDSLRHQQGEGLARRAESLVALRATVRVRSTGGSGALPARLRTSRKVFPTLVGTLDMRRTANALRPAACVSDLSVASVGKESGCARASYRA
jgi:hypothetical protein